MREDETSRSAVHQGSFLASDRPHVLMITNHGVHQWRMQLGLPDTGGQNVFVNMFTDALVRLGFKVTIVNRGGYPHPVSGEWRRGISYKNEHARILFIEDGNPSFVRKEDMERQIPGLVDSLEGALNDEQIPVDLIISHYWDGARVGSLINERLAERRRHVWVPHSLGTVKKGHIPSNQWASLKIDERIETEQVLISEVDGVAATSELIRKALVEDYGYRGPPIFLPPGIDPERYHPQSIPDDDPLWKLLSDASGVDPQTVRRSKIITEISRTDRSKRKEVVIEAFHRVAAKHPDAFLVITIDSDQREMASQLDELIQRGSGAKRVARLGSIWDWLPKIYAASAVYFTASVMEGFGMAVQEAAASGVPAVTSDLVPFATEYLLGNDVEERAIGDTQRTFRIGEAAAVVPSDDVGGYEQALAVLLSDDVLRERMGRRAHELTIPDFTWTRLVEEFLKEIGWVSKEADS